MKDRPARRPTSAWWDEPGPDRCDFCTHTFHLEVGYYCADCDRPVCPVCVVHSREHIMTLCPECGGSS